MAARSASQACSTLATPAWAERRTDSASCAWLMTFTPSSDRRLHDGAQLLECQLGAARDDAAAGEPGRREHRRLRRDDLDHVGSIADHLACGGHEGCRLVRLQAELIPVATGDADCRSCGQDARAGDQAGIDRVAERHFEIAQRTGAARGGHACTQRTCGVAGSGERRSPRPSAGGGRRSSLRSDRMCSGRVRRSDLGSASGLRRRSASPTRRTETPSRVGSGHAVRSS